MYTTFIVDEVGNRRIIMDWFKETNPTFGWSEVSIETLLESHPNHTAGLEFAYYYTGDDYRPQSGLAVSAEYGLLPDFKQPDLPAPRCALSRTGQHTRQSGDRSPVPVRHQIGALSDAAQPRIRCGLCAWNLGVPSEFSGPSPRRNEPPLPAEEPDHLSRCLNMLIANGQTTRRRLAESTSHKRRWNLIDLWCHRIQAKCLPQLPSDLQLEALFTAIDDAPTEALRDALAHDRLHLTRQREVRRWRPRLAYPDWATREDAWDGPWYRHHHCGRTTHDLAYLSQAPEVVTLLERGERVTALVERWRWCDLRWSSLAVPTGVPLNRPLSEFSGSIRAALGAEAFDKLRWAQTDSFTFVTVGEDEGVQV